MPRLCVLCGKCQSHSFSVFSFPSSIQKRNAWIKIILKANPDFINDKKLFAKNKLKNGVCELHFSLSEISNGKKRRLDKDSVPSLNIPTASSCNTILRKYETLLKTEISEKESVSEAATPTFTGIDIASNQNICNDNCSDPSLPDCTIEIEDRNSPKIYKCVVKDLSRENKGFCLCCGSHMYWKNLFSISKIKSSNAQESLLDKLAKILDVPQERIIKFSKYICRKCLKVVEDLLELNTNFQALLAYLKRKLFFNINRDDLDEDDPVIDNDSREDLEGLSRTLNYSNRNESYKFPCIDCSEKFENINSFCNHLAIHERNAVSAFKAKYNCLHCNQRFLTKSALTVHIKLHQQKKNSRQTCDRLGVEKLDLDSTIRVKEGEKIPECNSCEKVFTQDGSKYKLSSKTNRHFTCELCFRLFTHHMYQKHKFSCHSGKNILCDKCGEKFTNISKLNEHINTAHCNTTTIVCNICNEIFPTRSFYNHHLATKHKKKLHSCNNCGSLFSKQLLASQSRLNNEDTICYKCTDKNNEFPLMSSNINSSYKHLQESVTSNVLSDSTVAIHKVYSNKRYDESSRVLNILRPPDTFQHNNNLRTIEFPSASLKESEYMELSNDDLLHFDDNVNTLEDQSVVHDAIELGEDVSLINVEMLDSIETHEQSLNVNIETENQDPINIIDVLESDIATSTTVLSNSSLFSERTIFDGELKDDVPNVSPSLSSSCNITDGNVIRIVEPLVPPRVKQSNLQHISVTLKPDKSSWAFTNSLEHNNDASINPIIHSLDTGSSIHDVVPPITREIDITLPSDDEETKITSLSDPLNDNENKLTDHDLSPFSVDFDGKGDVRYVMFFESPDDKG